jgi:hypothetical protein
MLPKVLRETDINVFKFWFNGALQDGLHYDNELFYRALVVNSAKRTRLYHLGCKLSENGGQTVITVAEEESSLWLSLRSRRAMAKQGDAASIQGLPNLQI